MCKCKLLNDIEQCRREMIYLASYSSLSSKPVVNISKKLDKLLNLYDNEKKN
ncbi:aspartyl-phosphate phosphatase Spo0E family protein [Cytobacillus depressus]|uniref:Aspartyl-phosphate phosphatase Spo0E family protein n=1 Tax=Cytobacillus depressus TaxID=1602942 RepID=A0A6L3V3J1_9BACI|nr:aspartyl-phosphate phosphatase Spo0E family protein [Cytobacillus depressus]KAB2332170.1 aspartyl-phosphate phosphatase Spo0E family protein [Cytobacillus depressus]